MHALKRKETALKILITAPKGEIFDRHFPPEVIRRLESLGEVRLNPGTKQYTRDELKKELSDIDIVMTHWGSAQYDAELLDSAPKLKILAHCAGTVAHIASEECYKRKIHVLSANSIMAKFVAEGVLGMIIAVMREFTFYDSSMRSGKWERRIPDCLTMIGSEIGFIGLGTVGRCLLDLLRPIGCRAKIYDPYIDFGALENYEFASPATFEEAMKCPVVTVHASQTPETYHIINEKALSMLPDGGVLINSSRGSLVDTNALINELSTGRIRAALDVYEHENCAQDKRLLDCKNLLLIPHMAAAPAKSLMTEEIIGSIEMLLEGKPAPLEIPFGQYIHMTQE